MDGGGLVWKKLQFSKRRVPKEPVSFYRMVHTSEYHVLYSRCEYKKKQNKKKKKKKKKKNKKKKKKKKNEFRRNEHFYRNKHTILIPF